MKAARPAGADGGGAGGCAGGGGGDGGPGNGKLGGGPAATPAGLVQILQNEPEIRLIRLGESIRMVSAPEFLSFPIGTSPQLPLT